jgi:hypothetical protein
MLGSWKFGFKCLLGHKKEPQTQKKNKFW